MGPARSLRHGALMPLNRFRLTGFCPASKLFFAASQKGFRVGADFSALQTASRAGLQGIRNTVYMTNRIARHSYFYYSICVLLVALISPRAGAQAYPEPVPEHLLNGLTVLFSQRPGDPNVLIKLRVHSGAAFDFAGKSGTMSLLGDVLFPDPTTREYVTEQLGGKLDVATGYDGIDVTISGNASELERMVEFLRNALVNTQLTPENIAKAREARLKQLSDRPASAAEIADQQIAARLFGSFPYGHPAMGTVESVSKIDRGDLMYARERFLNADNATLVVIGGVDQARLRRTVRQLLGPWQKGDRIVPPTFRQPNPPDARVLLVNQPDLKNAEIRLAVRGLARSDRDAATASLLARIVRERWQAESPDIAAAFVRHDAHELPGSFVLGASVPAESAAKAISAAQKIIQSLVQTGPTAAELERARGEMLTEVSRQTSQSESTGDIWLDFDSFKLPPLNSQINSIRNLTSTDIQRVAGRLFKGAATATIVVGNAEQLKSSFAGSEVRGAKPDVKTAADPAVPAKKP
jgi:zinc protease